MITLGANARAGILVSIAASADLRMSRYGVLTSHRPLPNSSLTTARDPKLMMRRGGGRVPILAAAEEQVVGRPASPQPLEGRRTHLVIAVDLEDPVSGRLPIAPRDCRPVPHVRVALDDDLAPLVRDLAQDISLSRLREPSS